MQDYERKSISEVIEEINKKYFLPDIQRDFVWDPEQVYALFDSIMRDYPISTFLFWKQDGAYLKSESIKKLEFVYTSKEKNRENTEFASSKEYMLVLDGQQRLTTFFLVLKGNYIIRNNPYDLYFNVLSGDKELEDGILYEFKFFNEKSGDHFKEEDKKDKTIKLWFRVKNVYDINDIEDVPDILETAIEKNHEIQLSKEQKKSVSRLLRMLKYEKLIYYYPEAEKNYDKVLDIFVRTNSGGTQLSYSDLLFSTIKSKWEEARKKFDLLLLNINNGDRYKFSNDFILKTSLLLYAKNTEEVRYKTKNFKSDLIHKIKNDWNEFDKAVTLSVDLLRDRLFLSSYKTIASNNSIIPIVYWIFKNRYKAIGEERHCIRNREINKMGVWLSKSLLNGIFGGQSDTILYKCKEAIDASSPYSFPAEDIEKRINTETKKSIKLEKEFLDGISYNSRDSYFVLSVCYKGAVNFQPRFKGNLPEQDHIFSYDELHKAKIPEEKINTIYNIRYIGSGENKIKSNTPYSEWIDSIGEEERKRHFIPEGKWGVDKFNEFLGRRKKLMEDTFGY